MHNGACIVAWLSGCLTKMFRMDSGVLQGCPLSGFLFLVAADPILRALGRIIGAQREPGATSTDPRYALAACADDIAMVLGRIPPSARWALF